MPASRKRASSRPKPKKNVLRASTGRKARPKKSAVRSASERTKRTRAKKPVEAVSAAPALIAPTVLETSAPAATAVAPSVIVTEKMLPWRRLAAFFAFALVASAIGGFIIHTVNAATFQGPSQAAPGGNIPVTIWNRIAAAATQASASISVDAGTLTVGIPDIIYGNMAVASPVTSNVIRLQTGAADRFKVTRDGDMTLTGMSTVGSATLAVGAAQNLLYGNVDTTSTGSLLLFQNESVDRFRVDTQGRISTGSAAAVMAVGQNLIYGNVDTASTGNLLLLQNESADRLRG